jgi:hypothetical protein
VEPESENDASRCDCNINRLKFGWAAPAAGDNKQGFPKMINTLARAAALGIIMTLVVSIVAGPASAQAPSEAQREAVKAQGRSGYLAHCSTFCIAVVWMQRRFSALRGAVAAAAPSL